MSGVLELIHVATTRIVARRSAKLKLLRQLSEQCPAVTVSGASGKLCSTSILAIGKRRGEILMDDFAPNSALDSLREGATVGVYGELDGEPVRFRTEVLGRTEHQGVPCYRLSSPRFIDQRYKREHVRRLVEAGKVPIYLVAPDASVVQGFVQDISAGGIRVNAEQNSGIRRGVRLPTCTIVLPGIEGFRSPVDVRFARQTNERRLQFGGRFVDMDARQTERLGAIIRSLTDS